MTGEPESASANVEPAGTSRSLRRYGTREASNAARGPSHLLGRTGTVEEVADGILFLASDKSSFMTGADLLLDGGFLAFKGNATY